MVGLSAENWISIIGALVSGLFSITAMIYTHIGLRFAREQDKRRLPDLHFDYMDYRVLLKGDDGCRIYAFFVRLTNRSETDTSITDAQMRVYYQIDTIPTKAIVPHTNKLAEGDMLDGPSISLPLRIDGRQAIVGWLYFALGKELSERHPQFESYLVVIKDSLDRETSFQPYLIAAIK